MFVFLFRLFWRILVGFVALALALLTMYLIFPYLDDRLPTLVALILLYLLAAYIGIPFLVRMWHLVLKPNHLPIYVTTGDGWSSDPVNIAIVCKDAHQLIEVMEKAGWTQADRGSLRNTFRFAYAMLFKKPYPTAPFSTLYLFGRRQDIGFQIQTGTPPTPRHRHHVRFWQLIVNDEPHAHETFWRSIFLIFTQRKKQIWIGAATHDVKPFALRAQNLQITHGIDPDTNRERDFLINTLNSQHVIKRIQTIETGDPLQFRGQSPGVRIVVDGKLKVIELKKV